MGKKRISIEDGRASLNNLPDASAMAVRYLLQVLEEREPGGTVELRVPPYGAVQLVGGLSHRRGTPPNVVELDPESFLALALGDVDWDELTSAGKLLASGARAADVRKLFPISGVR